MRTGADVPLSLGPKVKRDGLCRDDGRQLKSSCLKPASPPKREVRILAPRDARGPGGLERPDCVHVNFLDLP